MNDELLFRIPVFYKNKFLGFEYHNIETGQVLTDIENKDFCKDWEFGEWEQCTGKKDKNGNLIYKNDIVITSSNIYGIVKFGEYDASDFGGENANLGFYIKWQSEEISPRQNFNYWVQGNSQKIEIVGNKYKMKE